MMEYFKQLQKRVEKVLSRAKKKVLLYLIEKIIPKLIQEKQFMMALGFLTLFIILGSLFDYLGFPLICKQVVAFFGLVSLISIICILFKQSINSKDRFSRIIGSTFLLLIFVILELCFLYYNLNLKAKFIFMFLTLAISLIFAAISLYFVIISESKIFKVVLLLIMYFIILISISWSFGAYYFKNNMWTPYYMDKLKNIKNGWENFTFFTAHSLDTFFNFPEGKLLCFFSVTQFFLGRLFDLFVLGYVFKIATSPKTSKPEGQ